MPQQTVVSQQSAQGSQTSNIMRVSLSCRSKAMASQTSST
jgi:hypothetical protein